MSVRVYVGAQVPQEIERQYAAMQAIPDAARRTRAHRDMRHWIADKSLAVRWERGADGRYHITALVPTHRSAE